MVPSQRSPKFYLFSKASRPVVGLTNLLVNLPGLLFLEDKAARALHPLPCIAVDSWHVQRQNYHYSVVQGMCECVTVGDFYLFSIYS